MRFSCEQCSAQYAIADEKVGPKGVKVRCKKCAHVILVKPLAEVVGEASAGADFNLAFEAEPPAPALAAPSPAFSDKEWYVAYEDNQIGPLDIVELERRWDAGEVTEDTLVWKPGFADWQAINNVQQLTYLVTERSQQRKPPPNKSTGSSARVEGAFLGENVFTGSSAGGANEVTWKPSAGATLAALVESELAGMNKPAVVPVVVPQAPVVAPQIAFSAQELFAAAPVVAAAVAPVQADAFALHSVDSGKVSARKTQPGSRQHVDHTHLFFVGLGLIVVLLLGFLVVFAVQRRAPGGLARVMRTPAVSANHTKNQPTVGSRENLATVTVPTAPKLEAPAQVVPSETVPAPKTFVAPKVSESTPNPKPVAKKSSTPRAIFDEETETKHELTSKDIIEGVKEHGSNLRSCLQAARAANEFPAGSYKFILEWTIRADGSVQSPKLKGPNAFLDTSLPVCFASKMKTWEFPKSHKAWPVRNFPLPIRVP